MSLCTDSEDLYSEEGFNNVILSLNTFPKLEVFVKEVLPYNSYTLEMGYMFATYMICEEVLKKNIELSKILINNMLYEIWCSECYDSDDDDDFVGIE